MLISSGIAVLIFAAASTQAVEQVDVAYSEMAAGQDVAAIRKIKSNDALDAQDPAGLINLGIAYARQGNAKAAAEAFTAAINSDDPQYLETSTGEWVDSRQLGRKALAMLKSGEFEAATRMANR